MQSQNAEKPSLTFTHRLNQGLGGVVEGVDTKDGRGEPPLSLSEDALLVL